MDFAVLGYYHLVEIQCRRNVTNIQRLAIQLFAGLTCLDGKFEVSFTTGPIRIWVDLSHRPPDAKSQHRDERSPPLSTMFFGLQFEAHLPESLPSHNPSCYSGDES